MKQKKTSDKKRTPAKQTKTAPAAKETVQTGLNEDPEERNIHDAMDDDLYDRAESELDD